MDISKLVVTPKNMKELENASHCAGVSLSALMDNAGKALAEGIVSVIKKDKEREILILAGNGNNAGDGFVCTEILKELGFKVSVVLLCGMPKTELSINAFDNMQSVTVRRVEDCNISELFSNVSVIVDCVFGTGFHGSLDKNIQEVF